MGIAGKKLLEDADMAKKGSGDSDEDKDDATGDIHPGKSAAMEAFSAAHKGGDTVGMAQAMSDFVDIHAKQK